MSAVETNIIYFRIFSSNQLYRWSFLRPYSKSKLELERNFAS